MLNYRVTNDKVKGFIGKIQWHAQVCDGNSVGNFRMNFPGSLDGFFYCVDSVNVVTLGPEPMDIPSPSATSSIQAPAAGR